MFLYRFGAGRQILFCDLYDQDFGLHAQAILLIDMFKLGGDIHIIKILRREVDRYREKRQAAFRSARHIPAHLLRHIEVKLIKQMVLLKRRNKFTGRKDSSDRIYPEEADPLILRADVALYVAKKLGKNRVNCSDSSTEQKAE